MSSPRSRTQRTARPCLEQSGKPSTEELPSGEETVAAPGDGTNSRPELEGHPHTWTTELLLPGPSDLRRAPWPPLALAQSTMPGRCHLCKGGSRVSGALEYCFGHISHCDNNLCYREMVPGPHHRLVPNGGTQVVSDFQVLSERTDLESRSFGFMGYRN